jgi:hypothetical protein
VRSLALLFLAACGARAAPAPRVSGTLAGAAWSTDLFRGTYCDHCAGGRMILISAESPDQTQAVFLELRATLCAAGASWKDAVWPAGDARISYGRPGSEAVHAVKGDVEVLACTPTHVRLRFAAKFHDGSDASGTIVTGLEHSAGYD